jgi:hypothetical protein
MLSVRARRRKLIAQQPVGAAAWCPTLAGGASPAALRTLRVCVQRGGSSENLGDLNVRLGTCHGGPRYWLAYGTSPN